MQAALEVATEPIAARAIEHGATGPKIGEMIARERVRAVAVALGEAAAG
jgi:tRNA nucleotidyltransferase (CCA-adding enzyme)